MYFKKIFFNYFKLFFNFQIIFLIDKKEDILKRTIKKAAQDRQKAYNYH